MHKNNNFIGTMAMASTEKSMEMGLSIGGTIYHAAYRQSHMASVGTMALMNKNDKGNGAVCGLSTIGPLMK